MHIWNTSVLVEELRARQVSQREKAKYLAVTSACISLLPYAYLQSPTSPLLAVEAVLTALITLVGITACYHANVRGDGEEFLDRFVCLSLPLGLRVGVVWIVIYLAYSMVGYAVLGEERFDAVLDRYTIADLVFAFATMTVFYTRLRYHILRASGSVSQG